MNEFHARGQRPFVTSISAGVLALGADYLGHAFFSLPLLPEQVSFILLRLLPLSVFSAILRTLTVLARPLLLVGATLMIIAGYGLAGLLANRLAPRAEMAVVAGLVTVVSAAIALLASATTEPGTMIAIEIVLLVLAVVVAYGVAAVLSGDALEDEGRRRVLRNSLYAALGVAAVTIGFVDVRRIITALATQQGDRAQTEITPASSFYLVSKNLVGDPVISPSSWRLALPDRSLTYQELLALPTQELEVTFECISNEVGGTLISNGLWKGPRVQDVLALTTVPGDSRWLLIESADGYTESFPLSELTPHHLLATHLNGDPLPSAHGFPARFVFPGHYGMKQPKWVTRLAFSSGDQPGYWENNGWNEQAVVKTMSRIDVPGDGAELTAGSIRLSGIAFSGTRRISAVELSWDARRSWHAAALVPEFSPYAWRFWNLYAGLSAGQYRVEVRARDGEGTLQSPIPAPTLPDGASGYHTIMIDVR